MPHSAGRRCRSRGAVARRRRHDHEVRHGPVPPGRRMFEVPAEETIELARLQGLKPILNVRTASSQEQNRQTGVTWTNLAFVRAKNLPPPIPASGPRRYPGVTSWELVTIRRRASRQVAHAPTCERRPDQGPGLAISVSVDEIACCNSITRTALSRVRQPSQLSHLVSFHAYKLPGCSPG